jgi:hypothetical protein
VRSIFFWRARGGGGEGKVKKYCKWEKLKIGKLFHPPVFFTAPDFFLRPEILQRQHRKAIVCAVEFFFFFEGKGRGKVKKNVQI